MTDENLQTSMRLSKRAILALDKQSEKLGVSRTDVIELITRGVVQMDPEILKEVEAVMGESKKDKKR